MKAYEWSRPALPSQHASSGAHTIGMLLLAGGIMAIIAGIATALDTYDPNPWGMAIASLGASASGIGVVILAFVAILTELRRSAFEAALRAGEVIVKEVALPTNQSDSLRMSPEQAAEWAKQNKT